MGALSAAIAERSRQLAQIRAADYEEGNRAYTVRITRPEAEPTFDRNLGRQVTQPPELVYAGPARITTVTPAGMQEIGDAPLWWSDAQVMIGDTTELDPRIDDIVQVVDGPASNATRDRRLRVTGVAVGGHLPTGYNLAVTGVAPSRDTG